eukprot:4190081-Amphidinium_carterae.1
MMFGFLLGSSLGFTREPRIGTTIGAQICWKAFSSVTVYGLISKKLATLVKVSSSLHQGLRILGGVVGLEVHLELLRKASLQGVESVMGCGSFHLAAFATPKAESPRRERKIFA